MITPGVMYRLNQNQDFKEFLAYLERITDAKGTLVGDNSHDAVVRAAQGAIYWMVDAAIERDIKDVESRRPSS